MLTLVNFLDFWDFSAILCFEMVLKTAHVHRYWPEKTSRFCKYNLCQLTRALFVGNVLSLALWRWVVCYHHIYNRVRQVIKQIHTRIMWWCGYHIQIWLTGVIHSIIITSQRYSRTIRGTYDQYDAAPRHIPAVRLERTICIRISERKTF